MKKLWVGYLLMMLSTNIILCISPFENSQLVLFPPFIGYIVMAVAYHKLKKEDPVFGRNGAGVTAMAILMILRFVSDGLGMTTQIPHAYVFVLGVKLIEIGALIYFTKIPSDLFARWEEEEEGEYHTRRLTVAWQNVAITQGFDPGIFYPQFRYAAASCMCHHHHSVSQRSAGCHERETDPAGRKK